MAESVGMVFSGYTHQEAGFIAIHHGLLQGELRCACDLPSSEVGSTAVLFWQASMGALEAVDYHLKLQVAYVACVRGF